jgi:serine acetyltransferase
VLIRLVDVLATAVKPLTALTYCVSAPFVRLFRLTSLRARAHGRVPVTTQFDGPVRTVGRARVSFGERCRLGREVQFETTGAGEIVIGERVRINTGCILVANTRIHVGDDTLIGEYVSIRDADHGVAADKPVRIQEQDAAEIRIGRDVWIGRGCCILKGVSIGNGAVIGANSVVTRDVPANSISVGAPARQIGTRGEVASLA